MHMSTSSVANSLRAHFSGWRKLNLLWLAVPIATLIYGWPGSIKPHEFPDSKAYKEWPADYRIGPVIMKPEFEPDKLKVMGRRPPVYPFFLDVFGTGPLLGQVQTAISIFAWGWFGWCVARGPGLMVGCIFSLLPTVWGWNRTVMTESISFSLVALAFAATLLLARQWTWPRFTVWSLCVVSFGLTRDTNLFGIPFMLIPVLTAPWRRGILVVLVAATVFIGGYLDSKANGRDRWPILNAIAMRILTNPEATAEFVEAGMPMSPVVANSAGKVAQLIIIPYEAHAPEYLEWFDHNGVFTYQKYLLTHPRVFAEAQDVLIQHIRYMPTMYFFRIYPPAKIMRLEKLYYPVPIPLLWWAVVLLPAVEFAFRRKVDALTLLAAALPLFTYFQVFVCYHGDGMEIERHILLSIVMYRVSALVSVAAVAFLLFRAARWAMNRPAPTPGPSVSAPDTI